MLDLAYVLLVVFILVITPSIQVRLVSSMPKPSNKPPTDTMETQGRAGPCQRFGAANERYIGAWRRS